MQTIDNHTGRAEEQLIETLAKAQARISDLEEFIRSSGDSKFQDVIDASPVPYALNDEEQNITYLNPAFIRTFGYDLDDIPTLADWWPRAYPDWEYQQWVSTTWARHLATAKQTNQPFLPLESHIRCKNGTSRTVLASAAPLSDSYIGTHLVILYDITERKKVEHKLYEQEKELVEIFDHLPSMIFLKDAKTLRYVRFNAAGEKLTGLSREEVIGRNDYDFFPKQQADFFTERDRVVIASGELEDIPDEPIATPQGTRSLHTRKVSIRDKDGNPKYLLGISDDITEQKEQETETARLQRELNQVRKMESLGQLTGGIAHDFNNLLAIISGFTQLGLIRAEELGDAKMMEYLQHIHSAEERATSLVAQMLAFSRNDKSDYQPLNLAPLVREDIKLLRATLPSSIQIETEIESNLPAVMMNETQLNQILMNLAINSRDAMDSVGRIDIRLGWVRNLNTESSVSHQTITGDWIELSVTDSGCGIVPDILDHIFTPFFTSKTVGKGTGMGLSVIYGIMKNCNGHILVESEAGKGSRFRLLFPPLVDVQAGPEETDILSIEDFSGKGEEILVVDDEQSLAEFIGEILNRYGYRAKVVTDSSLALDIIQKQPVRFSLVITDQTMPKMTGLELIEGIRKIIPGQPAIICSGYSDKINKNDVRDNNILYFKKPLDTDILIRKIHELLN